MGKSASAIFLIESTLFIINASELKDVTCGTHGRWFRVAAEDSRLYLRSGWLIIYILDQPHERSQRALARGCVPDGAIAQLGERCNRTAEVVGSIPTSSTKFSSRQFQESPKASVNAGFFYVYRPIGAEAVS